MLDARFRGDQLILAHHSALSTNPTKQTVCRFLKAILLKIKAAVEALGRVDEAYVGFSQDTCDAYAYTYRYTPTVPYDLNRATARVCDTAVQPTQDTPNL